MSTKAHDAAGRKALIDEMSNDVAAALDQVWQKWCNVDPDIDWQMFTAAINRFLKSGPKISGEERRK